MKQNIKKNNLPEFQEDIFIKEKIIQNIYGKIIHYNYSEIKGIYFLVMSFSFVRKRVLLCITQGIHLLMRQRKNGFSL